MTGYQMLPQIAHNCGFTHCTFFSVTFGYTACLILVWHRLPVSTSTGIARHQVKLLYATTAASLN